MTRQKNTRGRDNDGAPSQRQLRVGTEIRHALSAVLQRGEVRDPDLEDRSITVTEVRMSPDLKNATAFVMPLGGGAADSVLPALRRNAPFLRRCVATAVPLKFTPQLSFQLDRSFEIAGRIDRVLSSPAVQRDLQRPKAETSDQQPDASRPSSTDTEGTDDGA